MENEILIYQTFGLNPLFFDAKSTVNSGLNISKLIGGKITLNDFLDLTEQDIGTEEMDDYLIEVIQNLEDLKNE